MGGGALEEGRPAKLTRSLSVGLEKTWCGELLREQKVNLDEHGLRHFLHAQLMQDVTSQRKAQQLFQHARSVLRKKRMLVGHAIESLHKRAEDAALITNDVYAGRLENGLYKARKKPERIFKIFEFQISEGWGQWLIFVNCVHCMLALELPLGPWSLVINLCIQLLCCASYLYDIWLKATYQGWNTYISKKWQARQVYVVALLCTDLLPRRTLFPISMCWLRPAYLVCRVRSVRRFFDLVAAIIPETLSLCVPMVFVLSIFSVFANDFFSQTIPSYRTPQASLYALLTLGLTMDNFHELLPSDLAITWSFVFYVCFFTTFIVVLAFFLVDVMLGLVYDIFINMTNEQVASERQKELKGLTLAFCTLDPDNRGYIDEATWTCFLQKLAPSTSRQDALLYFQIASSYTGELDLVSFLDLKSHLSYKFTMIKRKEAPAAGHFRRRASVAGPQLRESKKGATGVGLDAVWTSVGQWVQSSKGVQDFLDGVVILDLALQILNLEGYHSALLPTTPDTLFDLAYLFDYVAILGAFEHEGGVKGLWKELSFHERFALISVIVHRAVVLYMLMSDSLEAHAYGWQLEFVEDLTQLLRTWRLVVLNDALHSYVNTFFEIFPVYVQTLSFAGLISFAFAMLGHEMYEIGLYIENFAHPALALRTMFQLYFDIDFGDIVGGTCDQVVKGATPVSWLDAANCTFVFGFFICYRLVGVMITLNLVNAVIIQFYSIVLERRMKREEEAERIRLIEESLTRKCLEEKTIRRWGSQLILEIDPNITVTRARSLTGATVRTELAAGGETAGVTLERLMKCKKYAINGCDLKAAYHNKFHGEHAYKEFEHEFTMFLRRENIGTVKTFHNGERIITYGTRGMECFALESGCCSICLDDGVEILRKHQGEIFGEMSFLNNSRRNSNVMAVNRCEVRVFTTADWLKMDTTIQGRFAQRIAAVSFKNRESLEEQQARLKQEAKSALADVAFAAQEGGGSFDRDAQKPSAVLRKTVMLQSFAANERQSREQEATALLNAFPSTPPQLDARAPATSSPASPEARPASSLASPEKLTRRQVPVRGSTSLRSRLRSQPLVDSPAEKTS